MADTMQRSGVNVFGENLLGWFWGACVWVTERYGKGVEDILQSHKSKKDTYNRERDKIDSVIEHVAKYLGISLD